MKKKWCIGGLGLSCFLACGLTFAQTNVQVYGVVDAYLGKKQLASAKGESAIAIDNGGLTTSYWGIRGSEDLGNGVNAIFDITGNFRVDTGNLGRFNNDAPFSRSSWVGVNSGWGTLRLGRMSSPNFQLAIRLSPFADSTSFGPYVLHTYVGGQPLDAAIASGGPAAVSDSGYNNAITYGSPKLNGFQGAVAYSLGEVFGNNSADRRISYALNYEQGKLLVAFGSDIVLKPTLAAPPAVPASNQKSGQISHQLGLTYDLGVAKAFASVNRTAIDLPALSQRKFLTYQLGVSMPYGPGVILLSGAQTTRSQTLLADVNRTTVAAGYDYILSKRTDLYGIVMNDSVSGLKSGTSLALGIRHRY
jgi:predicted porin